MAPLTLADFRVIERQIRISVVVDLAALAVDALRVVLAVVADASARAVRLRVELVAKVTAVGVVVAFAARARALAISPGSVVVQRQAALAVLSVRVVLTQAATMDHAIEPIVVVLGVLDAHALGAVTVARTRAKDAHLAHGVVVLLADVVRVVEKVVAEHVQLGEVDAQVGHLELTLELSRVDAGQVAARG